MRNCTLFYSKYLGLEILALHTLHSCMNRIKQLITYCRQNGALRYLPPPQCWASYSLSLRTYSWHWNLLWAPVWAPLWLWRIHCLHWWIWDKWRSISVPVCSQLLRICCTVSHCSSLAMLAFILCCQITELS